MQKVCNNCAAIGLAPFCDKDPAARQIVEHQKIDRVLMKRNSLGINDQSAMSVFVVSAGVIFLETSVDDVKSYELLYPGSFFGGYGHTSVTDAKIKATAAADALVCEIPESTMIELMKRDSRFVRNYLIAMGVYLQTLRMKSNEPSTVPLNVRLCKALYNDFKKRGQQYKNTLSVTKLLTHEEWGLHLGARRESISRIFKDLETQKIIQMTDGLILLKDEFQLLKVIASNSLDRKPAA